MEQSILTLAQKKVLELLGIEVPLAFTTTEELLKAVGYWDMPSSAFAEDLEKATGYTVVAFNTPGDLQIKTRNRFSDKVTVGQLHDRGWWLGGAGIYRLIYKLGDYGQLYVMVKDSTAGRVNLLAKPYLNDQDSGLHLVPVGLFRLTGSEQNEDWSVDPWVFLELLGRWGLTAKSHVQAIWNAMEVPLDRSNIGKKTVATVSTNGVQIVRK